VHCSRQFFQHQILNPTKKFIISMREAIRDIFISKAAWMPFAQGNLFRKILHQVMGVIRNYNHQNANGKWKQWL